MDVELYVYDLSKGLARQWSLPLTGTHMDAIYHTSIVLDGVEYYFGHGIQTSVPGSTHHGQPMERVHLGATELPVDIITEYIESLGDIYTPESYDLFLHNCNNFTQDLAMFLVGKSIPDHIRNLPQTFLSTPFGQMMKPQIEAALRGVTQAPSAAPQPAPGVPAQTMTTPVHQQPTSQPQPHGKVRVVANLAQLERELASASHSCAVIFFTSATCPPCKAMYPVYDELAEEAGAKAALIKVDISTAYDVSMKYPVRGTPTFKTYLKGKEADTWSGANASQLRGNIRLLLEMAHPTHPHHHLDLPTFQRLVPSKSYILFKSIPPLPKLLQKLPPDTQSHPTLTSITTFITTHSTAGGDPGIPLPPDLPTYPTFLTSLHSRTPPESHFAITDLTRLLCLDPRVSACLSSHPDTLITLTQTQRDTPYNQCLTTLHLFANLFTSPLSITTVLTNQRLRSIALNTLTTALLSPSSKLRCTAASLAYNLTVHNHNSRWEGHGETIPEDEQVELAASLVEAIARESESVEAARGFLLALGMLVYGSEREGAVGDLCTAMEAGGVVRGKAGFMGEENEKLVREVGDLVSGL
ncbi:putative thioredoxin [Aspergillus alliaceus]|uniref:Putative thioredoxin n=1 Tax=Petromyces alliaceus TaxID=209559 RepID=A0A5N7C176_PETAA|nr:putative thioredoxin [Aspergillus alliaceus]